MSIRKLSQKRLKRYWQAKLPGQEHRIERFISTGLLPRDLKLPPRELVCACSLMTESKTIYAVQQSLDRLRNESVQPVFSEDFFEQLRETLEELEMSGMRGQARRLRKLGQGIAAMQNERSWHSRWSNESSRKLVSAIKDEPFLPQQG